MDLMLYFGEGPILVLMGCLWAYIPRGHLPHWLCCTRLLNEVGESNWTVSCIEYGLEDTGNNPADKDLPKLLPMV